MNEISNSPLAQKTLYISDYDPSLLYPIDRSINRNTLGIKADLPFFGADIWNSYEVSWLNENGLPINAIAQITVAAISPRLIESKSMKLYLNSFNDTKFTDLSHVTETIQQDLSRATAGEVIVSLTPIADIETTTLHNLPGRNIDNQNIKIETYQVDPSLLCTTGQVVEETLCSNSLKSNCPVTGQPDWASVHINYTGQEIDHGSLLRYLVSFRQHDEFAEQCVERLFTDLMQRCQPSALTVMLLYTRRGGIDINPYRSTEQQPLIPTTRTIRQ